MNQQPFEDRIHTLQQRVELRKASHAQAAGLLSRSELRHEEYLRDFLLAKDLENHVPEVLEALILENPTLALRLMRESDEKEIPNEFGIEWVQRFLEAVGRDKPKTYDEVLAARRAQFERAFGWEPGSLSRHAQRGETNQDTGGSAPAPQPSPTPPARRSKPSTATGIKRADRQAVKIISGSFPIAGAYPDTFAEAVEKYFDEDVVWKWNSTHARRELAADLQHGVNGYLWEKVDLTIDILSRVQRGELGKLSQAYQTLYHDIAFDRFQEQILGTIERWQAQLISQHALQFDPEDETAGAGEDGENAGFVPDDASD